MRKALFSVAVAIFFIACDTSSNPPGPAGADLSAVVDSAAPHVDAVAPAGDAAGGVDLAATADLAATVDLAVAKPDAATGGRDWTAWPAVFTATGVTDFYAMGDVHGDPAAMAKTLAGAGLVDAKAPSKWTGGKALLVVTGDTIDKGTMALKVIDTFIALEADAAAQGGRVVVTLGNHEAEFLADPMASKTSDFQTELKAAGLDPAKVAKGDSKYGQWLWRRPVAAYIDGEWFLSHSGNAAGATNGMSAQAIAAAFQAAFDKGAFGDDFLVGTSSLLEAKQDWWSTGPGLDAVLAAVPAKHIVYGHQPNKVPCPGNATGDRPSGALFTCYGGKLFMEDVGMSYAVDPQSKGGLLHIQPMSPLVTAVYPDKTTKKIWP